MQIERRARRTGVDISIVITTVLDRIDAAIIDLSENGAQITGCGGFPPGARFQIEYMGQTLFAQCRWSEIDRMGVQFLFPLADGPLFERLLIARASQPADETATGTHIAMAPLQGRIAPRPFGRAVASFGRRA
jgi:hypothetical protein